MKKIALVVAVLGGMALAGAAQASPLQGRQIRRTVLPGNMRDTFTLTFRGGESAVVAVSGDGDTDLDLYVYDENGNLVGKSDGPGDDEVVRFTPRWTGKFRVVVINRSRVTANRYSILFG